MRIISEFAMPEESVSAVNADAVQKWLNESLATLSDPETVILRIVHGDATTYLRLTKD